VGLWDTTSRRKVDNALLHSPEYFGFLGWNRVRSDVVYFQVWCFLVNKIFIKSSFEIKKNFFIIFIQKYSTAELRDGLILYLPFDDGFIPNFSLPCPQIIRTLGVFIISGLVIFI
jgi:hypothetical protein